MRADIAFPIYLTRGSKEESDQVHFQLERFGRDYLLKVWGGDKHIGAVATATRDWGEGYGLPQHRELDFSMRWAKNLANFLDGSVTLLSGIHYDEISKEAIERILNHIDQLGKELIDLLSEVSR